MKRESTTDSLDIESDGFCSSSLKKQKLGTLKPEEDVLENKGDFVIDFQSGGEECKDRKTSNVGEQENMCRVCHMTGDCSIPTGELIQLGCKCMNDLGTAHRNCAELWFTVKGNKFCEICGVVARNISGTQDKSFISEWNGGQFENSYYRTSAERRPQPVCAFILAITVFALIAYWLLHERRGSQ